MARKLLTSLLLVLAVVATLAVAMQTFDPRSAKKTKLSKAVRSMIVAQHNRARAAKGLTGVKWSSTLAKHAQKYVQSSLFQRALSLGTMHEMSTLRALRSPKSAVTKAFRCAATSKGAVSRKCFKRVEGENIATQWGSQSFASFDEVRLFKSLVVAWINEMSMCPRKRSAKVGHWTQIVYAPLRKVGCGTAQFSASNAHYIFLICRYDAPQSSMSCARSDKKIAQFPGGRCWSKQPCPRGMKCSGGFCA